MNSNIEKGPKYPDALSRNLTEGGYTFLHRVFRKNLTSGQGVIINSGELYLEYKYQPDHKTFAEGLTLLEGSKDSETYDRLIGVVNNFELTTAIKEAQEAGVKTQSENTKTEKPFFADLMSKMKSAVTRRKNN